MQEQTATTGHFATPNAHKYMIQLCKHFGHKVPASVDGDHGQVSFAMGEARLEADKAGLAARLSGDDGDAVIRMQRVIDDHLKRFAFREDFSGMVWDGASS